MSRRRTFPGPQSLGRVGLATLLLLASPARAQPGAAANPTPPSAAALDCRLAYLEANRLFEVARQSNDVAAFRAAGDAYAALARRAQATSAAPAGTCGPLDEILLSGAAAYGHAGQLPAGIALLKQAVGIRPPTRLTGTAWTELAHAWLALAFFPEAAEAFERLAEIAPTDSAAPDGLENATLLRLALGDRARAMRNADRFEKNYGTLQLGESAKLALAVAEAASEAEQRGELELSATELTKLVDHAVDLSQRARDVALQLRAHAVAARRLAGKDDAAARRHAEAIVQFANSGALAALAGAPPGGGGLPSLGRALTAVGEAYFLLARMADRARKLPPAPKLPRGASHAAIGAWLQNKVAPWVDQREAALNARDQHVRPIADIQPAPPPRWVVASVGEFVVGWIELHNEIDSLAAQVAAAGDREHAHALRTSARFVTERARFAALAYLELRAKLQTTSEHGSEIEAWLGRTFPREHPLLEELAPEAHWASRELPPTAPLLPPTPPSVPLAPPSAPPVVPVAPPSAP